MNDGLERDVCHGIIRLENILVGVAFGCIFGVADLLFTAPYGSIIMGLALGLAFMMGD